ncbi:thiamine phosphate synthase [Roseovarius amoyensis]|uniref:thiamine phosphate synthase n=1 Tax=Roseovarius amoyensis TaxID=2211448 RepID=UPI000DBE39A6|nr:thiamine phosphate synthase [Roseovarius amoyensis]
MTLPRFYPIIDDVAWLRRMLPIGVKLVQLRIKDQPQDALRAQLSKGRNLCTAHGAVLVVNDHWQLAIELGCDWVHLGQEDLDKADVTAIRAAGLRLGISTHDKAELARALALKPDYIALGPIYPTILKKMKWHKQGVEKLGLWKELVGDIPLVAIGGMTTARASGAFSAGADIVAAVTDITMHDDPDGRVKEWLEVCG